MLSSNYLLKNGRYSIERTICAGPAGTIYLAGDLLRKTRVDVIERHDAVDSVDVDTDSLARTQHEGLVRINDDFVDRSCHYSATEPLLGSLPKPPVSAAACNALFERFGTVLESLNALSLGVSDLEVSPDTVVLTADGKLKLLYPGATGFAGRGPEPTSPFAPLEAVWDRLDHITQKAIYNSYDEVSLAILESPVDARSKMYSLAAVFYKLLTGQNPVPAVERSIEMLDSNADSLKTPSSLNPAINAEQSDFLMRMLEVRRERRFGSIEDAILDLPTAPLVIESVPDLVVPEPEDFPLLELPTSPVVQSPVVAQAAVIVPAVPPLVEASVEAAPALDLSAAFQPPFVATEQVAETPSLPTSVATMAGPKPAPKIEARIEAKVQPRAEKKEVREVFTAFEPAEPAAGGAMKYIAIGAGALVVAVGIGWAALSGSSAKQTEPATSMTAPAAVVQEQQIVQQAETTPNAEPVNASADTVVTEDVSTAAKPKPQIADTRAAPQKTPKPAVKNEAKPAKKLTVDDLIN